MPLIKWLWLHCNTTLLYPILYLPLSSQSPNMVKQCLTGSLWPNGKKTGLILKDPRCESDRLWCDRPPNILSHSGCPWLAHCSPGMWRTNPRCVALCLCVYLAASSPHLIFITQVLLYVDMVKSIIEQSHSSTDFHFNWLFARDGKHLLSHLWIHKTNNI